MLISEPRLAIPTPHTSSGCCEGPEGCAGVRPYHIRRSMFSQIYSHICSVLATSLGVGDSLVKDTTTQVLNRAGLGSRERLLRDEGCTRAPAPRWWEGRRASRDGTGNTELSWPQARPASTLEGALSAGDMPAWCCRQQRGDKGQPQVVAVPETLTWAWAGRQNRQMGRLWEGRAAGTPSGWGCWPGSSCKETICVSPAS